MQDEQSRKELNLNSSQSTNLSIDTNADSKRENYGDDFKNHLLEQYKLYVEMADRVSSRRVQIAGFYISILSALLAIVSVKDSENIFQGSQSFILFTVASLGLCLCIAWAANINSYKQPNSLKFKVIHEMELHLPSPCYDREWKILKESNNRRKYLRLTAIERYIPAILAIPYICLLIYSLLTLLS